MGPSQALASLVLLMVLVSSSASVLDDTCKSFGASNKDIGYDYCIKFFQANKGSATADKRGLAVVATKITRATAASTITRIAALKAADTGKKIQGPLADCDAKYAGAITGFDEAARGIAAGKLRDAATSLLFTLQVADSCEKGFRKVGVKSPMAAEDSEFTKECSITYNVARMLL